MSDTCAPERAGALRCKKVAEIERWVDSQFHYLIAKMDSVARFGNAKAFGHSRNRTAICGDGRKELRHVVGLVKSYSWHRYGAGGEAVAPSEELTAEQQRCVVNVLSNPAVLPESVSLVLEF